MSENVSVTRKEAREFKEYAVGFEKTNNKCIFVFPCNGNLGWYEMGDNSAVIYSHVVCKPQGFKTELQDDWDSYYDQFEIGRIRCNSITTVEKRIMATGLFREKVTKGKTLFFVLKKPLVKSEVDDLIAAEKARQAAINKVVAVTNVDARLDQMILEVIARLHNACLRHMDSLSAGSSGVRIVNLCTDLQIKYLMICEAPKRPASERLEEWKELRRIAHQIVLEINVVIGLRIWKRSKYVSVVEKLKTIEERIDTHIMKLDKKAVKNADNE